jgi:hypothetical protein
MMDNIPSLNTTHDRKGGSRDGLGAFTGFTIG